MTTTLDPQLLDDGLEDDDQAPAADDQDDDDDDKPQNRYPDVFAFVAEFLVYVFANEVQEQRTDFRWCSSWFLHTEALTRLEACWKAWEKLRNDPGTGASVWFRDHADPCMTALSHPDGPFSHCHPNRHSSKPALLIDRPPAFLRAVYDGSRPMS
jgi:hypothetical protein